MKSILLLTALLLCFFRFDSYAQEEIQSQKAQLPTQTQKRADMAAFTTRESTSRDKTRPATKQDANLLNRSKVQTTKRKPANPAVTTPDRNFSRTQKLPSPTPIGNTKTTAEEIVEIERKIVEVSASDAPKKDLMLEKLEKILEKKKLAKFKEDQLVLQDVSN